MGGSNAGVHREGRSGCRSHSKLGDRHVQWAVCAPHRESSQPAHLRYSVWERGRSQRSVGNSVSGEAKDAAAALGRGRCFHPGLTPAAPSYPQVIPQIQNADGSLTSFPTQAMDDGTGHIQLLQDGSHGSMGISCATTATTDLLTQAGQVQSIQGVPIAGGSAYTGTVPVGLPGNITFVPINNLDLEALGLTGAQTVPIATGVTPEGQLIMSGQTLESQGQNSGGGKQQLVTVSDAGANPELYVPTSVATSSSGATLPETIDGTGVLTQATAVSAGVSDPSSSTNFNSHNHLQQIQVRASFFLPLC